MEETKMEQALSEPMQSEPMQSEPVSRVSKTETSTVAVKKRILYVIVVLLVLNLSGTAFLIFRPQPVIDSSALSEQQPLPAELNSNEKRMELFDTLKKLYNDGQYDELYSMFHPLVQVELSQEELTKAVESIHEIWGDIENGAYSHYEYNGTSEGKAYFSLFYRVETTQEGMDILRILVSKEDNEPYELWELHMGE